MTPTPHHFLDGSHPAEEPSVALPNQGYLDRLNRKIRDEKLSKLRPDKWYWSATKAQAKAIVAALEQAIRSGEAKSRLRRRAIRLSRWSLTFHRIMALHKQDVAEGLTVA